MNKLFLILVTTLFMSSVFASGAAKIRMNISGTVGDNRYFLCIPDVGCLSILAASRGKAFPVLRSFRMNSMYLLNVDDSRIYAQGLPPSCNVTIDLNETLVIHGSISQGSSGNLVIRQFHCSKI